MNIAVTVINSVSSFVKYLLADMFILYKYYAKFFIS